MSANPFTLEQILSGIRMVWREALNSKCRIEPDMSFGEQFKTELADIDLSDVLYRLERTFGFRCPRREWYNFLGIHITDPEAWEKTFAPRLTFRALAEFIQERLKPVSFEPIHILGKPCLTAGVFRGLERLAEQVDPKVRQFAPSTPIRQCLRGVRLHRFWDRLRWIMEDQIPPPPQLTFSNRGCLLSLFIKFGIGPLIAIWRRDLEGLWLGIGWTFILLFPMMWISNFIDNRLNPLPEGIETFGDLARVLAAIIVDRQSEAASCSTP